MRREARIHARERRAARGEAAPSSDELVERLELQHLVAEELARLHAPLRTTLLLPTTRGSTRPGSPAATAATGAPMEDAFVVVSTPSGRNERSELARGSTNESGDVELGAGRPLSDLAGVSVAFQGLGEATPEPDRRSLRKRLTANRFE